MRSLVLSTVRPMAVALATLLAAPPAFARSVRCESRDYRYTYCRVDTYGDVRLRSEWSRFSCHFGRSWGYDHRGVWVDRGCRAEFAVDENRRGSYSGYNYDNHRSGNDKAAVAAGAVVLGAAVAAAIVASKNKNRQEREDEAPNWLVGRFVGYNTVYHADVSLQVSPTGTVTAFLPEGQRVYGAYRDGRVDLSGTEFDVERTGSGFTLTQRGDATNVVAYHRDR